MILDKFEISCLQVEEAVEDGDREGVKMLYILLRFLWRIFIMEPPRSSHSRVMYCVKGVRGKHCMTRQ